MRILSIILALLLFLCLADLSYGYYQFVRFIAAGFFTYAAYYENENGKNELAIIFVILALLFQPFFKVALGRELWNIVDVIVAVGLIGYCVKKK
jgi:hypothetical protein